MAKTNYLYDQNNNLFASRTAYVITVGVNGEAERPVRIVQTEEEAENVIRDYTNMADVDYDDDGNEITDTITAHCYALADENEDLWLSEKIAAHTINAAYGLTHLAETIARIRYRIKSILAR